MIRREGAVKWQARTGTSTALRRVQSAGTFGLVYFRSQWQDEFMKLVRIPNLLLLAAASVSFAHADTALTLGQAAGFNVFVFSNFTEYNTDAQGAMAVGGDFAPSGGSFTINATNHSVNGYGLVVGGNFTMNDNSIGGGNIWVGKNMTWNDPSLSQNAYVVGNFSNNSGGSDPNGKIYYGGTYSSSTTLNNQKGIPSGITQPINFQTAQTSLQGLSAQLAADTANGTVNHSYSTYTLTGTDSSLNVFNMTDSSYSGATINITAPSGSTVVINVAGTSDSFTNGSINLSGVTSDHVIFNFSQATSLSMGGIAFNGSVLAPLATFTGNYGQFNGELIALSASGTTQFNNGAFNGFLGYSSSPGATPEPGTWAMLAGALVVLAGKKMRAGKTQTPAEIPVRN